MNMPTPILIAKPMVSDKQAAASPLTPET